jgi:hypothetical protein
LLQKFGKENATLGNTHKYCSGQSLAAGKWRNTFLHKTKTTFIFRECLTCNCLSLSDILSFVSILRSGTQGPALQADLKNLDDDLKVFSTAVTSVSHIGVTTRASKYCNKII